MQCPYCKQQAITFYDWLIREGNCCKTQCKACGMTLFGNCAAIIGVIISIAVGFFSVIIFFLITHIFFEIDNLFISIFIKKICALPFALLMVIIFAIIAWNVGGYNKVDGCNKWGLLYIKKRLCPKAYNN